MGFLICINKNKKANLCLFGNTISAVTIATVVCKAAAEKISQDKGINLKEARKLLLKWIDESQELIG